MARRTDLIIHVFEILASAMVVQASRASGDLTALSLGDDLHAKCALLNLILVSLLEVCLQLKQSSHRQ